MPIFPAPCSLPLSALAVLLGMLALQRLDALPHPLWGLIFLPLPLLAWRYRLWRPAAMAAAGFLWAWINAALTLSAQLPAEVEGQDVMVVGEIISLPDVDRRRAHFQFAVDSIRQDDTPLPNPGRVVLNWYFPPAALQVGDRWRLRVRLKRPHGLSNPGGFDYEAWLFRHGLRATGYVRDSPDNRLLAHDPWNQPVNRLRQALAQRIAAALPQSDFRGIIQALTIGQRAAIDPAQWQVLTATGTNHLVAISGLHVGMVAGLAFFLLRFLWSRSARLSLRWPAPRAGAVAAVVAAVLYAALAGFSIPTQRTVIMVLVVMVSVMLGRSGRPMSVLSLALLTVLIWDPLAVLEPGLWLSFAAVALIFYGMGQRLAPRGLWWKWGRVQVLVAVGLAPLLLILFQRVSLVAPAANLLAVPWVTLVVVPLSLLGTALLGLGSALGAVLLQMAAGAMGGLWPLLAGLAHSGAAQWLQAPPPFWAYVPALLGTLWLLAPAGVPGRWLGVVLLAPMVMVSPARPSAGEVWFTLLDVGQGLAAVVETADHTLVFDTGPATGERFDAGSAVVLPYLRQAGIHRIDTLIVSHGDMDHRGGAAAILSQGEVGRLLTSVPDKIPWKRGVAEPCRAGQQWQWDGVRFEILYPFPAQTDQGNDASCVLRVATARHAVLLPGDIEKRSERRLVTRATAQLAADILVAPHHGSNTSSTTAFLEAVRPRYVLFAVGYRNRYGFPKPAVTARYAAEGVVLLDSAHAGAIRFRLDASPLLAAPERYRPASRRYWNSP